MDEAVRGSLVQLAVGGDEEALQRLLIFYHDTLCGIVSSRIDDGMQRHVEAEDIIQQAYVVAFRSVGDCSFDGPGGFYKWLETVALNELRDRLRFLGRDKRDIGREVHASGGDTSISYMQLAERLVASTPTPSRHMASNEATAAVMSCMARLTDEQRAVVQMRFLEGREVGYIAAELRKNESAIHMLCHRGLKRLRELMVSVSRYVARG